MQVSYDCNPKDNENLQKLQEDIQGRINFLNEQNLDSHNDPRLLDYYELHSQIQKCLFEDHSDQYLIISGVIVAVSLFLLFRWKMITKGKSSKNRLDFKE